jgi:hypothetical protein
MLYTSAIEELDKKMFVTVPIFSLFVGLMDNLFILVASKYARGAAC